MKLKLLSIAILMASCTDINLAELTSGNLEVLPPEVPNQELNEEWVLVPTNAGGMGLPAFYVMKYEAKAMLESDNSIDTDGIDGSTSNWGVATHKAVSVAEGLPWRKIDAGSAAAECEARGAKFYLISNPEWMAIARDIENQNENWTGGVVGSGCIFTGNSNKATCGYGSGSGPEGGTGRNARAKHTLSNSNEVFDLAGNVFEWTDWDKDTIGFQSGPTTCPTLGGAQWEELPAVNCPALSASDYLTDNGSYDNNQGTGYFYGGTGGAAGRGGAWNWAGWIIGAQRNIGVFELMLSWSPSTNSTYMGFRCVYRP